MKRGARHPAGRGRRSSHAQTAAARPAATFSPRPFAPPARRSAQPGARQPAELLRAYQERRAGVIQRLPHDQHQELQPLIGSIKDIWYFFVSAKDDLAKETLLTLLGNGLAQQLAAQREVVTALYEIAAAGDTIDALIVASVASRLNRSLKVLELDEGKILPNFIEEGSADSLTEDEHPISKIGRIWWAAKQQLTQVPDDSVPRQTAEPFYANQIEHKETLYMDLPPPLSKEPVAEVEDPALLGVETSNLLLVDLRDSYGLQEIRFVDYEPPLANRKRTNKLLAGLMRAINTQTHSYLGAEINYRVDLADRGAAPLIVYAKYRIGKDRKVTIRLEDTGSSGHVPESRFGSTVEAYETMQQTWKIAELRTRGVNWTVEELDKLNDTFTRLATRVPGFTEMLAGLVVIRSVPEKEGRDAFYDGVAHVLTIYNQTFDLDMEDFAGRKETGLLPRSYRALTHELGHLIFAARHRPGLKASDQRTALGRVQTGSKNAREAELSERISIISSTLKENKRFGDSETIERWQSESTPTEQVIEEQRELEEERTALQKELEEVRKSAPKPASALFDPVDDEDDVGPSPAELHLIKAGGDKPIVTKYLKDLAGKTTALTNYALTGDVNEEQLAEAFALYITDPLFVEETAPEAFAWFEDKAYLES